MSFPVINVDNKNDLGLLINLKPIRILFCAQPGDIILTKMLSPPVEATTNTMIVLHDLPYKASKTETLDMCQLPRSPFEIHKMINLPASVKIFKNKLKTRANDKFYFHLPHQAKRNNKLIKIFLSCLMAF